MNMVVFRVRGRVAGARSSGSTSWPEAWLAAELVEQAGVGAGDLVVEIGAGTGVLTEALARRAGRVVAVEYDPRLAERARARLAGFGNVRVVTADALALPMPRRPFRVVANLPFGSTAAILRRLLGDPRIPAGAGRPGPPGAGGPAVRGPAPRGPRRRSPGGPGTTWGPAAGSGRPASGRRRGSGRPCWSPGAGGRRWSRWAGSRRFTALVGAAFRHPGLPLRRGLVPPFTYRQLRRLARDLGFPPGRPPGRPRRRPVGRPVRISRQAASTWEDGVRARRIRGEPDLLTAAEGDRWGR